MRKTKALRLLSGLLALLTLLGGFGIVSGAESSAGDASFKQIGGLTDVLSTIKYEAYRQRYEGLPNNASKVISVDVVKDFRTEQTSSLCDPAYIRDVICNRDVLSKFFSKDAKVNATSLNLIDSIVGLEGFKTANPAITSIKIGSNADYTEYALFLMDPVKYHEKDEEKYPSATLSDAEKADLTTLENIRSFFSDITKKTVEVYDGNSPYKDELTGSSNAVYLPNHDAVGWTVEIPAGMEGYYTIVLRYYSILEAGSKKSSIERSVYIDGNIPYYEAAYVSLPKTYRNYILKEDGTKVYDIQMNGDFMTDINKNEVRPETELVPCWRNASLQDSSGTYVTPLEFYFTAGTHSIQLYAQRESMVLSQIELVPAASMLSYEEYLQSHKDAHNVSESVISQFAEKRNEKIAGSVLKEKAPTVTSYIKLEAEYPEATSEVTIYPTNDRTSCITSPQHPSIQYLNTLGGSGSGDQKKWSTVGQWVRYAVEVPESGFYKIALRFSQTTLEGSFVSRILRVQLAGESEATVPFAEAYRLQFDYADDWQVGYLTDGNTEFSIYLEEGVNYIELEANLGDMSDIIRRVSTSLDNINNAYIKFLMLAGSSPDADRNYGFYRRIPEAVLTLSKEAKELYAIADEIVELTGMKGSHVATLTRVAQLLERMGKDEDQIARNLDSLKSNLGTLGTWVSDSRESPLELDYLMITPGDADTKALPKATPNFFQTIWFECRMFVASFTTDYNTLGLMEETDDSESIIVWTTTGRDQANIIRSMINNDFTKNTGVAVNLKLVAGGSLLPSVLAGVGPDVSMGHTSSDMINWAIRSALVELTDLGSEEYCKEHGIEYDSQFDARYITGFANVLAEFHGESEDATVADNAWFNTAAMVPMTLHEVISREHYDELSDEEKNAYGDYDVQYYKDITVDEYDNVDKYEKKHYTKVDVDGKAMYRFFISEKQYKSLSDSEKADYKRADTEYYEKFSLWGLPQEQTFNMMFYRADIFNELGITPPKTWDDLYAIIGVLQSNNMEIAMPTSLGGFQMFLYQMDGDLYSNGGQTISLDENLSISAFEMLCSFFQSYKFPIAYDFSNRFRSGEIPMGIQPYTSYTQLSLFATEIKGMWEFVPMPGVLNNETGEVNNVAVSGSTGLIMLKGAKDRGVVFDAWKYMAWFTSASAQSDYASEVTAVLGTESKHPTANSKSLYELPWTSSERDNLAAQFDNLVGIPEYPGGYIISRYVNFAFLDVYNDNADPVTSIQEYVVTINAELTRKRQEFGLAYKDVSYSNS